MDLESKHSYIGSFIQPPDKIPSAHAGFWSKNATADTTDISAQNNQALVLALKTLQEKIHRLELERSRAEDDLNSLSREAAQYKKALQCESSEKGVVHQDLMQERRDVNTQLRAAQSRCSLLEKQLDYMRKMVVSAELDKRRVLEQQTRLQEEKDQNQVELCAKLDKLDILEKECWRLTSTQNTAAEKIKQLEEKLLEEQHQRKLIQDKAAQLQTGLEMNRILMASLSPQKDTKKKSSKKKAVKKNPGSRRECGSQPNLQAATLPFVAGKSTSSSHSVAANVQSVLHMMKYRSPQRSEGAEKRTSRWTGLCRTASYSASSSASENLSDLLLVMQDELGQMSFEHQELLKQIQETQNPDVREDLERELDCLVKQMENKGEQISKLKKHQENVYKLKQKAQKLKRKETNAATRPSEFKETAFIPRGSVHNISSMNKSTSSLQLLKSAQKLQLILKKDDIIWEP
ncbi:centrosomal protein CEP57L1 [Hemicordylus capensis]|uniref:centrosomal protein CEP57L1 n=1 Tax=Hemicordylus capensis TaxID=884348 RepID=UPI0023021617|nr:centrosomal protein CEP57L1 [Hemicordylus capensis]XP_053154224.1 centrosomal protein CEP57L1 [Hemicordylus capensis]XP_053154317.1 centrosomal protein CEP57L1 [Hemicordylus capensis]XP_053154396.1 centrosomal protein CEP57L1 [Hemicordylus capensis]